MAEYDDVPWAVSRYTEDSPKWLRKFIHAKYRTIERAVEHLQDSSSAMPTYLKEESTQRRVQHERYQNGPSLLKPAMVACNPHGFLTSGGKIEPDTVEQITTARMLKHEYLAVLENYRLQSTVNWDRARMLVDSLIPSRENISADVSLEWKTSFDSGALELYTGLSNEESGREPVEYSNAAHERKQHQHTSSRDKRQTPRAFEEHRGAGHTLRA